MKPTDKEIVISCGECDAGKGYIQGLDNLINHILSAHPNYSKVEAEIYAEQWLEAAYAEYEETQAEAAEQDAVEYQIDEAIERDIEFKKHGL